MRILYLTMSLSGTIIFILWLIMRKIFGKRLKERWKRNLLLLAIPFYLLPISYLKFYFYDIFVKIHLITQKRIEQVEGRVNNTFMVFIVNDRSVYSLGQKILILISGISVFIALCIFIYHIIIYLHFKNIIIRCKKEEMNKDEEQTFILLKEQIGVKSKVNLIKSEQVESPFTMGIQKFIIMLPANLKIENNDYENILKHELAHIKHRDMLVHCLALLVMAIHWYNPFCYFYLCVLHNMNELYSDKTTTRYMTYKEKNQYCNLLISEAEDIKRQKNFAFHLNFRGVMGKEIKGRIDTIMRKKKFNIIFCVMFSILFLYSGTYTAFAYERVQEVEGGEEFNFDDEEEFIIDKVEEDKLLYDDFFIDKDNMIYPILYQDKWGICSHNFVEGTRMVHKKNGKGCEISYYDAKKCIKCGKIITGELYKKEEWKICPH